MFNIEVPTNDRDDDFGPTEYDEFREGKPQKNQGDKGTLISSQVPAESSALESHWVDLGAHLEWLTESPNAAELSAAGDARARSAPRRAGVPRGQLARAAARAATTRRFHHRR